MDQSINISNTIRRTPRPQDFIGMSTQELRDTFQISGLFVPANSPRISPTSTGWWSAA